MSSKRTFTKKLQSALPKRLNDKLKKPLRAGTRLKDQLSAELTAKLNSEIERGLNTELGAKINEQAQKATKVATHAAMIAAETAKGGLDQVLVNLEHRGFSVKESQDLAQKIGRKVLERAEAVREQIAASPLSPAWLKEVTLKASPAAEESMTATTETAHIEHAEALDTAHANSLTESTISEPVEFAQAPHVEVTREEQIPLDIESDELDTTVKTSSAARAAKKSKGTKSTKASARTTK